MTETWRKRATERGRRESERSGTTKAEREQEKEKLITGGRH